MDTLSMKPDERALRADLAAGSFLLGVAQRRWRLVEIRWPVVQIAVSAASRPGAPEEWFFRFDCSGYPQEAPTARPCAPESDQPIPTKRWPGGRSRVPAVFRPDWKEGTCLYLPCDRVSAPGHAEWGTQHPALMWSPSRGIVLYLEELHALLNSSDYSGVRSA